MEHNKLSRGRPSRSLIYARLGEALAELDAQLGGLPNPDAAAAIWTSIWHLEAHHSTALEGNTLVLNQVELLLAEGLAVGNKELREYMEVRGYADAASWVYSHGLDPGDWTTGALLSLSELRYVHTLAMEPVWSVAPHPNASEAERPGSFRQHEIKAFPGGMRPPSWPDVNAEIESWLASLSHIGDAPNPIEELARAHWEFERIHPFLDGNGRTGRLVLNLMLVRLGMPPAIIFTRDRSRYLAALRRGDKGDVGSLAELLARSVTDNVWRFILPALAANEQLVPLLALATPTLRLTTLRAAIERGRLKAFKGDDGQWRSSKVWVEEYLASRYKR